MFKLTNSILLFFVLNLSFGQSDGCTGVPSLTMGIGTCSNTAFSLPGSFSNGGLVNASCATGNNRDDGWFSFTTGPAQTTANIEETSTNRTHLISVWTACGGGTELGCNVQASGNTANINLTGLSPSTTYYIQIHRRGGGGGASISGNICVYEPVPVPPVPEDCNGGTTVCSSSSFSGNSSGGGNVSDLDASNQGCLTSGEHESSWYYFSAATSGDFAFTIVTSVDYDFAVWGPYASVTCPPTEAPLRCSYSGTTGNTGLLNGSGDNTENASGNKFVEDINANAGEVFILLIDNFTSDASGFDLNWSVTNGGSLDCTPLPVELANFYGTDETDHNLIHWETKSESDSKEFIIEKSRDGLNFERIGSVNAMGNSSTTVDYQFEDLDWRNSINYYRIKMVDLDETFMYSHIISIKRKLDDISIYPNPTTNSLSIDFGDFYSGEFELVFRNALGQVVEEKGEIGNGNSVFQSNKIDELIDGLYFVEISDQLGNSLGTYKIIKQSK